MKKGLLTILFVSALLIPVVVHAGGLADLNEIREISISKKGSETMNYAFTKYDNLDTHNQALFSSTIRVESKCYKTVGAYCASPGVTNRPEGGYKCDALDLNKDEERIIDNIINSSYDEKYKAAAVRMYVSTQTSLIKCSGNSKCTEILKGYKEYYDYGSNPASYHYLKTSSASSTDLETVKKLVDDSQTGSVSHSSTKSYKCESENASASQVFYIVVKEGCDTDEDKCSETTTETVDRSIEGYYKNCCEEDLYSYIEEVTLDELFSDWECLGIPSYKLKNGTNDYLNTAANGELSQKKMNSNYCQLYCTERVNIAQPGAFNVAIGHYFNLNSIEYPKGSGKFYSSPVVENHRRCRVRIKFDAWANEYTKSYRNALYHLNEYNKFMKVKEYYENGINNHATNFDGGAGGSVTFTTTCGRGTLTSCGTYDSTTWVDASCTVKSYNDCETGWTAIEGEKCEKTSYDATSETSCTGETTAGVVTTKKEYDSTRTETEKCKITETKPKTVKDYTCTDSTSPPALTAENSTVSQSWSFTGTLYYLGTGNNMRYRHWTLNTSGKCYNNVQYTSEFKTNSLGRKSWAFHENQTGIINQTLGYMANYATEQQNNNETLIGKKPCDHKPGSNTYYSVSCWNSFGVLNGIYPGNVEIEDTVQNYNNNEAKLEEIANSYINKIATSEIFQKELHVCQTYFSEQYGSDPDSQHIKPELDFYYEQFYLDNSGNKKSDKIEVRYKRKCTNSPVEVPNINIYADKSKIVQIADNSIDQLVDVRYSSACGSAPLSYSLPKCNNVEGAACTTASAKEVLNNQYNYGINYALHGVTATPSFEYDAMYSNLCYWEPVETASLFTAPAEGYSIRNWESIVYPANKQYNKLQSLLYIGSDKMFSGKFQTYIYLRNVGTAKSNERFNKYIKENGISCAGVQLTGSQSTDDKYINPNNTTKKGWAPFTCTYKAYEFESRYGGCTMVVNGKEIVTIDTSNCNKNVSGPLYAFRIIDPDNMFPQCTNTRTKNGAQTCYNSIKHSQNWLLREEGYNTIKEIETSNNFDLSNLTYSFKLDSQAMKAIKAYNKERLSKGGYVDNDLDCKKTCNIELNHASHGGPYNYVKINADGSTTPVDYEQSNKNLLFKTINGRNYNVAYYNKACNKCYSEFLTELAQNKVNTERPIALSHNVWNRNKTITEVRNSLSW